MKSLEEIPRLGKDRSQFLTEEKYNEIVSCVTEFDDLGYKERRTEYSQGYMWSKSTKF